MDELCIYIFYEIAKSKRSCVCFSKERKPTWVKTIILLAIAKRKYEITLG